MWFWYLFCCHYSKLILCPLLKVISYLSHSLWLHIPIILDEHQYIFKTFKHFISNLNHEIILSAQWKCRRFSPLNSYYLTHNVLSFLWGSILERLYWSSVKSFLNKASKSGSVLSHTSMLFTCIRVNNLFEENLNPPNHFTELIGLFLKTVTLWMAWIKFLIKL